MTLARRQGILDVMGRTYDTDPTGEHEGYLEHQLFDSGQWTASHGMGCHSNEYYRAACGCGWTGPARRIKGETDCWLSDIQEDALMLAWEQHMAPISALADVADANSALHAAAEQLQLAVEQAVIAGASWAQIGAELGVSRQAAWERFAIS